MRYKNFLLIILLKILSRCKLCMVKFVKDKDGKVFIKLNEYMERWNEYFIGVLNRLKLD